MSRHFNYELDERRIKTLLKENSMPYSDDVWTAYLEKTKPLTKINKFQTFKPNVSFAINKSVLLTGVFVILIGSFTFLIAKFVDFGSARSNIETIREVKPNPDNYKIEKIASALPTKEELKPISVTIDSSLTGNTPTVTPIIQDVVVTTPTNNSTPDTTLNKTDKDSSGLSQKTGDKPRRKKKKQVETLESKPLTSELPTTGNDEPELELK